MCLICIDLDKGKLTPWEAARNRLEMVEQIDDDHLPILNEKIKAALLQYLNELNASNSKSTED